MRASKKYAFILAAILFIVGCGTAKKQVTESEMHGSSMVTMEVILRATQHQVDSVCTVDSLPSLRQWTGSSFIDFETRQTVVKKMYIRHNNGKETMYIVIGKKEPYIIEKRICE